MSFPHPNDMIVGGNIRLYRQAAEISQVELGEHLGVTFQQVQKYEKGTNRVGAGRLPIIATVLKIPVATLFDGVKLPANTRAPVQLLQKRDAFKLAVAFNKISDPDVRHSIVMLAQSLSKS
jgi:transcriptional regulator with XRE-family HTH domain